MEQVIYSRKRATKVLGVSDAALKKALAKAPFDGNGELDAEALRGLRETLKRQPKRVRPQRRQLFLNFKGGTGKTALSSSYAYRLSEMGYRVLVLDLDSQGHATKCLGFEGTEFEQTLFDVLVHKTPIADVVMNAGVPGLDFVPSNLTMATVDLSLMPMAAREFRLSNALKAVEGDYDFVIMDAPPSFGLLNLNALIASQDLIVPVLADFLSFHGLKLLFETVTSLEEDLEHAMERIFVVVNAYNASFKIAKEALWALRDHYEEYLVRSKVRQCTKFAQASSEGVPIFVFDPESKGAEDIESVMKEILGDLYPARR